MRTFRRAWLMALVAVGFVGVTTGAGWADLTTKNSGPVDITVNVSIPCDTPVRQVVLGSWSASNGHSGSSGNMQATFTIAPAMKNNALFDCLSIHYLQVITADTCPATVNGAALPFPQIDPPPNGWDYMYKDGAGRTYDQAGYDPSTVVRNPANADPRFASDTTDTLPWYHTAAEEADTNIFKPGDVYKFTDRPGDCPDAGVTAFSLYLVGEVTGDCAADSTNPFCLQKGSWLVMQAVDWSNSSADVTLSAMRNADNTDLNRITTALSNSGFTNGGPMYTLDSSYVICCDAPEPATAGLLGVGVAALILRRRAA